jgi:hypothetical protein
MLSLMEMGSNSLGWILAIPITMGVTYAAGLYKWVSWLKKLRRSDRFASDSGETALSKTAGT